MNQKLVSAAALLILVLCVSGCPEEPIVFSIKNDSDRQMSIMINPYFPDSSLNASYQIGIIRGRGTKDVHHRHDLTKAPGLTIFLFDLDYSKTAVPENDLFPDGALLDRDSVLKMYYHTNAQLDSLGRLLVYP